MKIEKKTIANIALNNDKRNRARSILIMVSIFLSTVLLTVICTCAYGMIKFQKANASVNYGSYYGTYRFVDTGQLQEMRRRSEFELLGLTAQSGIIDSPYDVSFLMVDQNAGDMMNASRQLAEGAFPQAEDEVAAQAGFFESIGYPGAAVGDTVTFGWRKNMEEKYHVRQFTVSGILSTKETPVRQTAYTVYASPAFYEKQFSQHERRYSVLFRLAQGVPITNDDAQEVLEQLAKKCGIGKKYVSVNSIYLLWTLDPGYETIYVCVFIAMIVIVLSVVVIYNIFQVGIVQKIQEYGKIRALGATKKQMRRLIYNEGMYLAAYSIPAGVLAGFVLSWASFHWLVKKGREAAGMMEYVEVPLFHVPVLLFGAFLAFGTVCLALRRSVKVVASISPVEAVRYQEGSGRPSAGIRKGRKNLTVASLAFSSLSANRRRTITTVLTMGLSCVLFVTLTNCVGNIDTVYEARKSVPYGRFQIALDYSIGDKAYPENNLDAVLKDNPLNEGLMQKIRAIPGVTDVRTADILFADVNGKQENVIVFDEDFFAWTKKQGGVVGALAYEDSAKEDLFYYCWSHFLEDEGVVIDSPLSITFTNGSDVVRADGVVKGSFGSADASWAITRQQYERMGFSGASAGWLWVDCDKGADADVRRSLQGLLEGVSHTELTAYQDVLDSTVSGAVTMKVACYLFLGIIGLIGFMNMANTIIMNIITKKQEYGVLQAVGMTNRQMNFSLQLQGIFITAGTVLVAVAAGLPAGYAVFVYASKNGYFGMNRYHVPFVEIGGMVLAITLLQIGLSYLLSRNLKRESLIERIRYQG